MNFIIFFQDYINNLPTVVDLSKIKPGTDRKEFAQKYLLQEKLKERKMLESLKNLQVSYA